MKALILAGGFAKRLWPLTLDKAKPLLPVAGKPVISHIIETIPKEIGIIVSTNEAFASDFFAWRETHPERDITVFVEPSQTEGNKKGALAAVALAINAHAINEDLLVIGGDNFFTFSVADFLSAVGEDPTLAVFDIQDLELAKKFGVVVSEDGIVTGFQEKPEEPASTHVATACYFYPCAVLQDVLEAAKEMPDKLSGPFEYFLRNGTRARTHTFQGYWNDIGSFDAYLHAHVQSGRSLDIPKHLLAPELGNTFEGVNHVDPSAVVRGSTIRNSIVLADASIIESTVDTCIVDRGAVIRNETREKEIVHV